MSDGKWRDCLGAGGLHGGVNSENPSNQDVVRSSFDEPATRDFDPSLTFNGTHSYSVTVKARKAD